MIYHMLLLASSSPRRSELLKMAGYDFTVAPTDVNEKYLHGTPPMQIVEQLASRKAQAAARANPQDTVLGADTLVVFKGRVFGKPKDADDAKVMITANYAIQKSSNSFFYEVGYRLGITNMNLYAKRFGLGVKTGIELSESAGILGGPSERAAAGGGGWFDADTVEAAVGQADNKFTPLQLATYVATIANNGVRQKPHLVSKVTDYAHKNVISQTAPEAVDNIGVSQSYIDYVKAAMKAVYSCPFSDGLFLLPAPAREDDVISPDIMKQLVSVLARYYDHADA